MELNRMLNVVLDMFRPQHHLLDRFWPEYFLSYEKYVIQIWTRPFLLLSILIWNYISVNATCFIKTSTLLIGLWTDFFVKPLNIYCGFLEPKSLKSSPCVCFTYNIVANFTVYRYGKIYFTNIQIFTNRSISQITFNL